MRWAISHFAILEPVLLVYSQLFITYPKVLLCGLQAVQFLVIHQKHKKSLEEITNDLCPVLSVQQLYRISTMYWDDRYGTETVSHEVCCPRV